jgi:hypothetical protein
MRRKFQEGRRRRGIDEGWRGVGEGVLKKGKEEEEMFSSMRKKTKRGGEERGLKKGSMGEERARREGDLHKTEGLIEEGGEERG